MAKPLNVITMPLYGRHLIEASAGTGKTYNITRLYLRLLLETGYSVTQILVMTFTNAATQELKGRLSKALRDALIFWQSTDEQRHNDEFLSALYHTLDKDQTIIRLKKALAEMDEAAVFTLHGFCYRVLTQQAFTTGNPVVLNLQQDQTALIKQSISDWFRVIRNEPEKLVLLAENNWHSPERFYKAFSSVISQALPLELVSENTIVNDYQQAIDDLANVFIVQANSYKDTLLANEQVIHEALIDNRKDTDSRESEWRVLVNWISAPNIEDIPEQVFVFLKGNRYARREDIKAILTPIKESLSVLKKAIAKAYEESQKRIQQMQVLSLVISALSDINNRIDDEKRRNNDVSFDDLIVSLSNAVCNEATIAAQLLTQFPVALIDEFQDTDERQYQLLDAVYRSSASFDIETKPLLVMIGDPKQAIYSFRGGDIFTYLKAREDADYLWLMDTNWRSVENMVSAYNRLFWGNPLSSVSRNVFGLDIHYEQINSTIESSAAKRPLDDPMGDTNARKALTFCVAQANETRSSGQDKKAQNDAIANWCVAEIQRLLTSVKVGERTVAPADIAILVRSKHEAIHFTRALKHVGLSAVYLSDRTPLFESEEAHDLYRVIRGIWYCQNDSDLLRAISSPLLGVERQIIADMHNDPTDPLWSEQRQHALSLRLMWMKQGTLALILYLVREHFIPSQQTERALTNYLHLSELIENALNHHSHPLQAIHWFEQQLSSATYDEAFEQRLESDAGLIKIVTLHKSKGLEYPFVFIPYATEYRDPTSAGKVKKSVYSVYDPKAHRRYLQMGATAESMAWLTEQDKAETIRLLYVAVTRAEYRCYLGVAQHDKSHLSALGICLNIEATSETVCGNWAERFAQVFSESDNEWCVVDVEHVPKVENKQRHVDEQNQVILPEFTGNLQPDWHIHSFSALTRFNHGISLSDREWESVSQTDEHIGQSAEDNWNADARFSFPKGAVAGNFLHDVLEITDFSQPNWLTSLATINQRYDLVAHDQLDDMVSWLNAVINAPFTCNGRSIRLCELSQANTLREAEFYFSLDHVNRNNLITLLSEHRHDLVNEGLADESMLNLTLSLSQSSINGMMHGFIDLLFTVDGRYYVADYKSNSLGERIDDYHSSAMVLSNIQHGYDLQYLIYSVALHRYLGYTLDDYEFSRHFGGVHYFYLRGMHPSNEHEQGVVTPVISELLIMRLDQLLGHTIDRGCHAI